MSEGYVYILTNEAMPGLVKIGKTTRSVEQRVQELNTTGVPFPFFVEHEVLSPNCHELEMEMHVTFRESRVSAGREFFKMAPFDAVQGLDRGLKFQIDDLVSRYDESLIVVHEMVHVKLEFLQSIRKQADLDWHEITGVIECLEPQDLSGAKVRYAAKMEGLRSQHRKDCPSTTSLSLVGAASG